MGFSVVILAFRVVSHTLEPKENYKKLPISAKERKGRPGMIKDLDAGVANKASLVSTFLVLIIGVIAVRLSLWLTGLIGVGVLCFTTAQMTPGFFSTLSNARKSITGKRLLIFIVSMMIGLGFVFSMNSKSYTHYVDRVIPFAQMSILFIVVKTNLNSNKEAFFRPMNILYVLGSACIIRGHVYFDPRYEQYYKSNFQ